MLPETIEMRELFRLAAEHDVQIRRMNYRRDSLEDIFLAAMKENGGARWRSISGPTGRTTGPLTPERWRFLVLPRYALQELFESRVLMAFLVLCLFPFLVGGRRDLRREQRGRARAAAHLGRADRRCARSSSPAR